MKLTARQAAERLGVSRRTLGRYVAERLIAPERTGGGHLRFDAETVDQLAEQLAESIPSQPPPKPTELPGL